MTQRNGEGTDGIVTLVTEIERWNRQINLVSRVRTRRRVDALVAQCRAGWHLAAGALAGNEDFTHATYFDLGSGAGLPGLVWATERARLGHPGPTVLVEPRDKRAWFLRRTARLMGLDAVTVQASRWGDGSTVPQAGFAFLSLKALRLDDAEVLAGLAGYRDLPTPLREVVILRFLDPVQHSRDWLEETFAAPDRAGELGWIRTGVETLGEGDPRLLLTRYRSA